LNGNPPVEMPAVWVKSYGAGRVFYCSVGHRPRTWPPSRPARSCAKASSGPRGKIPPS
jgi:type 1 glutamine amidotransferase